MPDFSFFLFMVRWTGFLLKLALLFPVAWLLYPVYPEEIARMKTRHVEEHNRWVAEARGFEEESDAR